MRVQCLAQRTLHDLIDWETRFNQLSKAPNPHPGSVEVCQCRLTERPYSGADGSSEAARLCLEDGCYLASVDGDEEYPSDVSFAIDGHGGAGAPYGPVAFFASGGSVIRWGYCTATAKPAVAPIARGTDEPASAFKFTDREVDEIAEIFKTDPRWRQLWHLGQKSIEEKEERIQKLITEHKLLQNLLETYDTIDPNQISEAFRRLYRQYIRLCYLQKKATIQKHRAKRILNAVEEFRFDSSEAGHLEKLEELAALECQDDGADYECDGYDEAVGATPRPVWSPPWDPP